MADVKISALPLASTPLAGTEVLPIVQSATTDQVSVANLTAGRSVSAASLTLTTTPLAVGSGGTGLSTLTAGYIPYGNGTSAYQVSNIYTDGSSVGIGISSLTLAQRVEIGYASGTEGLGLALTNTIAGGYGSGTCFYSIASDNTKLMAGQVGMLGTSSWSNTANASSAMLFKTIASGTLSEKMRITSAGLVGIGTTSPNAIFQVKATTNQNFQVSGSVSFPNSICFSGVNDANNQNIPMEFRGAGFQWYNSGTLGAMLDTSGNLGLGVTPSAWLSSFKATQIGNGAAISGRTNTSSQIFVTSNAYIDSGATWRYLASDYAVRYYHDSGKHIWDIASSGTAAGAITFTQAMTLDASGRLGIGITSPAYKLDVFGERLHLQNTTGSWVSHMIENDGGSSAFYIGINDSAGSTFSSSGSYGRFLYSAGAYPLDFYTNSTIRARIDSSGNLLVGTTTQGGSYNGRFVTSTGSGLNGILVKDTQNNGAIASFVNNSNALAGTITISGTTTTYGTTSDISLKTNITSAASSLASILSLPIRQFDWKSDGARTDYGVVAQEAYDYAPEMVTQGDLWSVDYGRITPRLIKAFQELAAKVAELEAKI